MLHPLAYESRGDRTDRATESPNNGSGGTNNGEVRPTAKTRENTCVTSYVKRWPWHQSWHGDEDIELVPVAPAAVLQPVAQDKKEDNREEKPATGDGVAGGGFQPQ